MTEIIYKNESYAIIGACFEVYNEKGCGFLEPVYQGCLGIEFEHQRIPAIAKPLLALGLSWSDIKADLRAGLRLLPENYRRAQSGFHVNRRTSRTAIELSARNRI